MNGLKRTLILYLRFNIKTKTMKELQFNVGDTAYIVKEKNIKGCKYFDLNTQVRIINIDKKDSELPYCVIKIKDNSDILDWWLSADQLSKEPIKVEKKDDHKTELIHLLKGFINYYHTHMTLSEFMELVKKSEKLIKEIEDETK